MMNKHEKILTWICVPVIIVVTAGCGGGSSGGSGGSRPFMFKVKTDNPGKTASDRFLIPAMTDTFAYDYDVDCDSDGTYEVTGADGNYTCVYPAAGIYTISIRGDFPDPWLGGGKFSNKDDKNDGEKVLSVEQWGTIAWKSMASAFKGCPNMDVNATDIPDLSGVSDMSYMFAGTHNIKHGNFNQWNVSRITNMYHMFAWSVFNQDISDWNTGNVTTFSSMFCCNNSFNRDIGRWDTKNAISMEEMFHDSRAFNQDISDWNVGKVTDMSYMFASAYDFNQDLSAWDVSNVTTMFAMFDHAITFNGNVEQWCDKTANVTNMSRMFKNTSAFSGHDLSCWDVSKVTAHTDFSTGWGSGNTLPDPSW